MKKLLDTIANVYLYIALACMIALISILTVEIIMRYFFSHSINWSQELFSILVCWITFLGFGKLIVDREDISITFLVQKFSKEKQRIVLIINSIFLFLISCVMLVFSIQLTISHLEKKTIIMKAASAWFYSPLVLLLFLVVLTALYQTYLAIKSKLTLFAEEEVG